MFWRMMTTMGMAETQRVKKRHFSEAASRESLDDEVYADRSRGSGRSQRGRRGERRVRKRGPGPAMGDEESSRRGDDTNYRAAEGAAADDAGQTVLHSPSSSSELECL